MNSIHLAPYPNRPAAMLALALLFTASATALPDWREPFGGFGHRSADNDVRAPLTAPVEAWSLDLGEILGEPVVSSGTVFIAAREKRDARVYAIDLATGEELHSTKVAAEAYAHVSVLDAAVVAVTDAAHYYFEFRGGRFKRGKVVRETYRSPATLLPGLSFVTSDDGIAVLGLRSGKLLFEGEATNAKPVVTREGGDPLVAFVYCGQSAASNVAEVRFLRVSGAGTSQPEIRLDRRVGSPVRLQATAGSRRSSEPFLMHLQDVNGEPLLLVSGTHLVRATKGSARYFFGGPFAPRALPLIVSDPVMLGEQLVGRMEDGTVITNRIDGGGEGIIPADARPQGFVDGPITAAGNVLLLGNWAYELDSRRILWTAPDMDFDGPLRPVADGTVLYRRGAGGLVCARDTNAGGTDPGAAAASEPARLPEDLGVKGVEPYALLTQAREALDRSFAEELVDVFGAYSKRRLLVEARRVLEEAQARGLPDAEVRALEGKLSGKSESKAGNKDRQLKAAQRAEVKARTEAALGALEYAGRMVDAGLKLEAASLAAHVSGYFVAPEDLPEEVALERKGIAMSSMTAEFPFRAGPDADEQWLRWATELAPAGAWFVDPASILDRERKAPIDGQPRPEIKNSSVWKRSTVGLRTQNLMVLSRSKDPGIVGACLRTGEGAIQTLETLLENPPHEDDEPLEVRIHKTRSDYLKEDLGEGQKASDWSLGFYAPWLRASRFHVPDSKTSFNQGRALDEVVAHELTHQYIAERWREVAGGRRTSVTPGFWIVEGFARFIEDQSLEIARRGDALDDHTVQSVESASALHALKGGLKLKDLVRLNQVQFQQLPDDDIAKITLKSTLIGLTHSGKSAFYDQAAALVFFLANRCGPEGRGILLDALRDHYLGETGLTPWRAMGFKTRASMERALDEFLENPSGGHVDSDR